MSGKSPAYSSNADDHPGGMCWVLRAPFKANVVAMDPRAELNGFIDGYTTDFDCSGGAYFDEMRIKRNVVVVHWNGGDDDIVKPDFGHFMYK